MLLFEYLVHIHITTEILSIKHFFLKANKNFFSNRYLNNDANHSIQYKTFHFNQTKTFQITQKLCAHFEFDKIKNFFNMHKKT